MPGLPTEVFNEDIKELKGDIRELRGKIDLVKDDVHRVDLAVADPRGEFRVVKLLLTLVIAGIGGSLWQFYNLNAKVNGVEARFERMDARFERLETSVAKILEQTSLLKTPSTLK